MINIASASESFHQPSSAPSNVIMSVSGGHDIMYASARRKISSSKKSLRLLVPPFPLIRTEGRIIRMLNNEIIMVVPPRRRQRASSMSMASFSSEEEEEEEGERSFFA